MVPAKVKPNGEPWTLAAAASEGDLTIEVDSPAPATAAAVDIEDNETDGGDSCEVAEVLDHIVKLRQPLRFRHNAGAPVTFYRDNGEPYKIAR